MNLSTKKTVILGVAFALLLSSHLMNSAYLYIPHQESKGVEMQKGEKGGGEKPGNNFDCLNVTDIPLSECQALLELYNSTDGANRSTNTNRLQGNEACTRYGVFCAANPNGGNSVQSLTLEFNNLVGTISNTINNLTQLEVLQLHGNTLEASIPSVIGSLTKLTILNLGSNQLEGSIPTELGNLVNLERLALHENQLQGSIPDSFGNLKNVYTLFLFSNKLSGIIPSSLGNMHNLQVLNIQHNSLDGEIPSSFGDLSNLAVCKLDDNSFCGFLPEGLMNTLLAGGDLTVDNNRFMTAGYSSLMTNWLDTNLIGGRGFQNSLNCTAPSVPVVTCSIIGTGSTGGNASASIQVFQDGLPSALPSDYHYISTMSASGTTQKTGAVNNQGFANFTGLSGTYVISGGLLDGSGNVLICNSTSVLVTGSVPVIGNYVDYCQPDITITPGSPFTVQVKIVAYQNGIALSQLPLGYTYGMYGYLNGAPRRYDIYYFIVNNFGKATVYNVEPGHYRTRTIIYKPNARGILECVPVEFDVN